MSSFSKMRGVHGESSARSHTHSKHGLAPQIVATVSFYVYMYVSAAATV